MRQEEVAVLGYLLLGQCLGGDAAHMSGVGVPVLCEEGGHGGIPGDVHFKLVFPVSE